MHLGKALGEFDQKIPNVESARDVIMHFSEYTAGIGNKQRKLQSRDPTVTSADLANQFATRFGYDPPADQVRIGSGSGLTSSTLLKF